MLPWRTIDRSQAASGGQLFLCERNGEYLLRVDNWELMSSRKSGSEEAMAEVGCKHIRNRPDARVLVAGLGLGYSLRATLDVVHPQTEVTVAEFVPEIIEWNRHIVGHLADRPLDDPRVKVIAGDVKDVMKERPGYFDAILLDLDNGPQDFIDLSPKALYGPTGLKIIRKALRGNQGVLVIWAGGPDPAFEKRMKQAGFRTDAVVARARKTGRGAHHVLFTGRKA